MITLTDVISAYSTLEGKIYPNINVWYGPHDSLNSAIQYIENICTQIGRSKVKGITVAVEENGTLVEYWNPTNANIFIKKHDTSIIDPATTTSTPRPNKKMYIRNSSDNIGLEVSGGKIIDSSSSVILAGGNLEMSYIDKITPLYIEGYGTSIDSISSIRIIDNKGGTIPVEETSSAGVFRTTSSLYSLIEENDITFIDIKVTKQVDTTTTSTRPPSIKVTNKSSLYLEFQGPVNDITQGTGTPPIGPNSSVFLYKGNSSYDICYIYHPDKNAIFMGRSGEITIKNATTLEVIPTRYDSSTHLYIFDYIKLIEDGVKEIIIESNIEGVTTTTSTTPPTTTTTTSTKYPSISLTNSTNQDFILTAPIVNGRDYQDLPVGGTAYIKQDDSVQTISLSNTMLDMKNADIIIRVYTAESSYEFYQFEKKESSIEIDFATLISNKNITRVVIEGTINFAPTTTTKLSNIVYYGVIKGYMDPNSFCSIPINKLIDRSETKFKPIIGAPTTTTKLSNIVYYGVIKGYMDPNSFCSIPINKLIDRSETKFKPIIGDSVNEFTIPQDGYFSYLIIPVDKVELQYAAFTSGGLTSTYYDSSKPNTPTALDPTPNGAYYSKYTRGGTAPYNKGGSYKGIDYDVYFAYINSGSIPEMINIRAKNK